MVANTANATNTQTAPRPDAGIAALSLSLCSLLAIGSGFQASNPLLVSGGFLGSAVSAGYWSRRKVGLLDIQAGLGELTQAFEEAIDVVTDKAEQAQSATLKYIPEPMKPYFEKLTEETQSMEWVSHFQKWSGMVIGARGSGKTFWNNYDVYCFVRDNPEGRLKIGDINYGKPDEDGNVNIWMGLPLGSIIQSNPVDIYQDICDTWNEMQRRKAAGQEMAAKRSEAHRKGAEFAEKLELQPYFHLIDEASVTFSHMKRYECPFNEKLTMFDDATQKCSDLLLEGRGYKIIFRPVFQDPNTTSSGFGRDDYRQMNVLILGKSAIDAEVLGKIPQIGSRARDLVEQVEEAKKQPGCKRACIVCLDNAEPAVSVRVVPEIKLDELKIDIPVDTLPPHEQWLKEVIYRVGADIRSLTVRYVNEEIPSPWEQILKLAGIDRNRSRHGQKYDVLKSYWEQIQIEVKKQEQS